MPGYRFAVARRHGQPLVQLREVLAHDTAAIARACSLGAIYPEAAVVTVACKDRTLAAVPVNRSAALDDASRNIRDSRALIASARQLLDDTAFAQPPPDEAPTPPARSRP